MLLTPISNPDATIAGNIGMNISARTLINFCNLFDFSLTCCLISSLDTSSAPVCSIKSLYTLSTPTPITI